MTEKQRKIMYEKIAEHGENLRKISGLPASADMLSICKKLFTLENKGNRLMVDYCNGLVDTDTVDYAADKLYNSVLAILKISHLSPIAKSIQINRDPRGYTLKIFDDYMRENNIKLYRDFGGYGIIAPDFRTN